MNRFICTLIGYLFGSFLSADAMAKSLGKDVRDLDPQRQGEGNPGALNIMQNISVKAGLTVLTGDVFKTLVAMTFCYFFFYRLIGMKCFLYCGFGSILGHDFPFWRKLDGGKGVLTTLVWVLIIMPVPALATTAIGLIILLVSGYLDLAACISLSLLIPYGFVFMDFEYGLLLTASLVAMLVRSQKDLSLLFKGQLQPIRFFHKENEE